MRFSYTALAVASHALLQPVFAVNFTISNGQIYTPGFVIVDSPQPGTPLGGDTIEVAIDVTADGILPLNVASDSASHINNITMFMYSYVTGRNFTISNGTANISGTVSPIMSQEPSSTVKHVKWIWPACLVGNGAPSGSNHSDRGDYNISIRQNFRLNGSDFYTIFDLPIEVTNSIDNSVARPDCDSLNNPLMTPEQVNSTTSNGGVLFAPGGATQVQYTGNSSSTNGSSGSNGSNGTITTSPNQGALLVGQARLFVWAGAVAAGMWVLI